MHYYDPLRQYPSSRTFEGDPGVPPTVTNEGRVAAYGMPNMGGKRMSRRNEMLNRQGFQKRLSDGTPNPGWGDGKMQKDGYLVDRPADVGGPGGRPSAPVAWQGDRPKSDGSPAYPGAIKPVSLDDSRRLRKSMPENY